jgi:hypothetical protein
VWDSFQRSGSGFPLQGDSIARPAAYRRPDQPQYLDHAVFAAGSALYVSRFAAPAGTQLDSSSSWQPREFFDPTQSGNANNLADVATPVRQVYIQTGGTGTTPPVYALRAMPTPYAQLPFAAGSAPPIQVRPRSIPVIDPAGIKTDYFAGTGNAQEPDEPSSWDNTPNFFYGIHDDNKQQNGARNDGIPMWVNSFENTAEGVVNRNGGDACTTAGITKLYGFEPRTGNMAQCLVYPPGSQYAGQATSVVDLGAVGVPSDLIAINNNLYFATSSSGLQRVEYRNPPRSGDIRSFRRVK